MIRPEIGERILDPIHTHLYQYIRTNTIIIQQAGSEPFPW